MWKILLAFTVLISLLTPSMATAGGLDPTKRIVILVIKQLRLTEMLQLANGEPQVVFSTENAIGRPGDDTPIGRFQVSSVILAPKWRDPEGKVYQPNALDNPMGGAVILLRGQDFALHGTNRPDLLGQRVSHGCIRNANILPLAHSAVPGTAVYIEEFPGQLRLSPADFDWANAAPAFP